jgi:rhodanese-related sulfurtransferase
MLIDVRESFEYKKSRIKGAINIPSSGNTDFATDTIDKSKDMYLYCTSGFRSKRVSAKFAEKGFAGIINLEGGIKRWKEDGFPVEKKKIREKRK